MQEDDPGWDCETMGNLVCGPSQGGPTTVPFEWVQHETCPFSSPAVASPECSTEVTPSTLIPTVQDQPAPLAETLPVTGSGVATAAALLAYFLILAGVSAMLSSHYYTRKRKQLEAKWAKEDAEETERWKGYFQ